MEEKQIINFSLYNCMHFLIILYVVISYFLAGEYKKHYIVKRLYA